MWVSLDEENLSAISSLCFIGSFVVLARAWPISVDISGLGSGSEFCCGEPPSLLFVNNFTYGEVAKFSPVGPLDTTSKVTQAYW